MNEPDSNLVLAYNTTAMPKDAFGEREMAVRQPRLSKEEHARIGTEIYENRVRPLIEFGNHGRIVAIDVETGEFEVADKTLQAAKRLLARCPGAQTWFVRIGHPGVHRFGLGKR